MQSTDLWSDQTASQVPVHRIRVKVLTRGLVFAVLAFGVGLYQLDINGSPEAAEFAACDGLGGFVQTLTTAADGRTVFACTSDGKLTVWEAGSAPMQVAACASCGPSVHAAFASNARVLGVSDHEQSVVLWDLEAGRPDPLPMAVGMIRALGFSPDGATVALADGGGVRLVDVASRALLSSMALDMHEVASLAFSPDAHTLALGSKDGLLRLWHLGEGSPRPAVRSHGSLVSALAFSANGSLLATASHDDDEVVVWSAAGGEVVSRRKNHASVQALAFAPGAQFLATAGRDGAVRMWDVSKPDPPRVVLEEDGSITALAFSQDGNILACGGMGWIRLYRAGELAGASSR